MFVREVWPKTAVNLNFVCNVLVRSAARLTLASRLDKRLVRAICSIESCGFWLCRTHIHSEGATSLTCDLVTPRNWALCSWFYRMHRRSLAEGSAPAA